MLSQEEITRNGQALSEFVHKHRLMNNQSIVHFKALATIKTVENEVSDEEVEVRVTFDGYDNDGHLYFTNDTLDTELFPTDFDAKWQKMEHVDGVYLSINGTHKLNPKIGKYTVKVVPLGQIN